MNRDQLEHILRAAGAITGRKEWVIVGSQAILGAVPPALAELDGEFGARIRPRLRSANRE